MKISVLITVNFDKVGDKSPAFLGRGMLTRLVFLYFSEYSFFFLLHDGL